MPGTTATSPVPDATRARRPLPRMWRGHVDVLVVPGGQCAVLVSRCPAKRRVRRALRPSTLSARFAARADEFERRGYCLAGVSVRDYGFRAPVCGCGGEDPVDAALALLDEGLSAGPRRRGRSGSTSPA